MGRNVNVAAILNPCGRSGPYASGKGAAAGPGCLGSELLDDLKKANPFRAEKEIPLVCFRTRLMGDAQEESPSSLFKVNQSVTAPMS